jgi:hypothetical protein
MRQDKQNPLFLQKIDAVLPTYIPTRSASSRKEKESSCQHTEDLVDSQSIVALNKS